MKKVLSSLVVLGILLCMFMSLGISADAAEGPKDLAVVALAFDELTADQIGRIKESLSDKDVLVIDVNGLDGDGAGYSYAYSDFDQGFEPGNYKFIWPGMSSVPTMEVSDGMGTTCKVVLLPIGPNDSAESIGAYKAEGTVVIAVAPEGCYNVQAAVDSGVDKVLTCGAVDATGDNLIKVGADSANPVSVITVDETGFVATEAMPLPAAADPDLGPVEPSEQAGDPPAEPDPAAQTTTYTITFQPGEGATGEMASATAEAGTAYGLPGYCDFTCPGYDFIGWQIGEDVYYAAYDQKNQTSSAGTVTVNSDITATALWQKQATQYSVAFYANLDNVDENGESIVQGKMDTVTQDEGTQYTLPGCGFTAPGFQFVKWQIDGADKNPGDVITLDKDVQVYAVWEATSETSVEPVVYTITFAKGSDAAAGEDMPAQTDVPEGPYTLPECKFTVDGYEFAGWSVSGHSEIPAGTVYQAGDNFQLTGEGHDITLTATWNVVTPAVDEKQVPVTYKSGENGQDQKHEEQVTLKDGKATITLIECPSEFTVPDGKAFAGWLVGSETKSPGDTVDVTDAIEITAQWKDKPAESQQNVSPIVDGVTPAGDLTYTQGGTDILSITYKAAIDKVTVNNSQLVATQDYTLSADGKTLTFVGGYLNKVLTGTYPMQVTFKADADGTTYAADNRNLVIKPSPAAPSDTPSTNTATTNEKVLTWDRAHDLTIDLSEFNMGSPTKLEIKYSDTDWREVKAENYVVNGTSITLKTTMLPANWPNQGYTYRVTFGNAPMTVAANGTASNTALLKLQVTGIANGGTNPTATATPSPNTNGGATSPVTGDTNNVTLYIVLLVVLIAALAAVLIIVMKRRKR